MLSTDDIWAELKRRRITAKAIAICLGVSTSTVTRTINGDIRTPNPEIIAEVASLIGVSPELLRPGYQPVEKTSNTLATFATSNHFSNWTNNTPFVDKAAANSGRIRQKCQSNESELTDDTSGRAA